MLSAVRSVVSTYKHVHPIRCTAHQPNLVVKDLLDIVYLKTALGWVVDVARWFKSHHIPLHLLKEEMQKLYAKSGTPALPVATRWQSNLNCVKSILDFERAYKSVFLLAQVETELNKKGPRGASLPGNIVIGHIQSPKFWEWLKVLRAVVEPVTVTLIDLEGDVPRLSKIHAAYHRFLEISVDPMPAVLQEDITRVLKARWSKITNVRLTLAAILDISMPEKQRLDPTAEQIVEIEAWLVSRYGPKTTLTSELVHFIERSGPFANPNIWSSSVKAMPLSWWKRLVVSDLSILAIELLSIIPSSTAAERCWSSFGYIHSKSRNWLTIDRAEKLVYVYVNSRLFDRINLPPAFFSKKELTKGMDEDSVTLYELAEDEDDAVYASDEE